MFRLQRNHRQGGGGGRGRHSRPSAASKTLPAATAAPTPPPHKKLSFMGWIRFTTRRSAPTTTSKPVMFTVQTTASPAWTTTSKSSSNSSAAANSTGSTAPMSNIYVYPRSAPATVTPSAPMASSYSLYYDDKELDDDDDDVSDDFSFAPTVINVHYTPPMSKASAAPLPPSSAHSSATGSTKSASSCDEETSSFDELDEKGESPIMPMLEDSLCYSISGASKEQHQQHSTRHAPMDPPAMDQTYTSGRGMKTSTSVVVPDQSVLSFLNQADEAYLRLYSATTAAGAESSSSAHSRPGSGRTLVTNDVYYDFVPPTMSGSSKLGGYSSSQDNRDETMTTTQPRGLVVGGAVVDGVSFLDMSVWSVDPFYASGGEAAHEPEKGQEQEQRDDDYYNSIKVPPSPTRIAAHNTDDDNGTRMTSHTTPTFDVPIVLSKTFDETPLAAATTQENNDEYDDDCDSTTTVVPRAILQHSMTYDVSVLTMDPTLLTGSPYVEF